MMRRSMWNSIPATHARLGRALMWSIRPRDFARKACLFSGVRPPNSSSPTSCGSASRESARPHASGTWHPSAPATRNAASATASPSPIAVAAWCCATSRSTVRRAWALSKAAAPAAPCWRASALFPARHRPAARRRACSPRPGMASSTLTSVAAPASRAAPSKTAATTPGACRTKTSSCCTEPAMN